MYTATINNSSNFTALFAKKRPEYQQRHDKLILLHDDMPFHTSKLVQDYLKALNWEVLRHPAYSPNMEHSDYHPFSLMGHALEGQHFAFYENVRDWLDDWFALKYNDFIGEKFIICREHGKRVHLMRARSLNSSNLAFLL